MNNKDYGKELLIYPEQGEYSSCEICHDLHFIRRDYPIDHPMFGRLEVCDCQTNRLIERLKSESNLNNDETKKRLDQVCVEGRPGTGKIVDEARVFVQKPIGILTIYGSCGNAKTEVLQAIVNELIEKKIPVRYITGFDLLGDLKSAINEGEDVRNRLRKYEDIDVLVVDEFDKVRETEWVDEQLTQLIDIRYRNGINGECGTVVAMNKHPREFNNWIFSRLSDGRNRMIGNNDSDMRPLLK
ncbi:DnaA ATPase domain-containing protein [Chloroflexota bacterium]